MKHSFAAPDARAAMADDVRFLEEIHAGAMRDLVRDLTDDLRDEARQAGLGDRLAKTWRGKAYPAAGGTLHPAGYVWSKAPKLIGAYAEGATIRPTDGRHYLAIPTANVPLKGRGRRMTPLEVETAFNQDLIVRPGRGGRKLAFVNVLGVRSGRGFRPATKRRLAQGRAAKLVLMFILVPQVQVARRLSPDAIFERQAASFDARVQTRWDAAGPGRRA